MMTAVPGTSPAPQEAGPPKPPRRRFWLLRILAGLMVVMLVALGTILLIVRSPWFAEKVKSRIISEVETSSGGRAELTEFRFDWKAFTASVSGFILHGTEASGETPLLAVESVKVGIGLASFGPGMHVRRIEADRPRLHIVAREDGKTNLPTPRVKQSDRDFIDTLLDLAAGELIVRDGLVEINERRIPLNLRAENANVHLTYNQNRKKPLYFGDVLVKRLNFQAPPLGSFDFGVESSLILEHGDVRVSKARLFTKQSHIELSGFAYHLLNPSAEFGLSATLALSEMAKPLRLPLESTGTAVFAGKVVLALKEKFGYVIDGQVRAHGLAFHKDGVKIDEASLESQVHFDPAVVDLKRLKVLALGGAFAGSGKLDHFEKLTIDGTATDLATDRLIIAAGLHAAPYASRVNGPVHVETSITPKGPEGTILRSQLTLTSSGTENALSGLLNFIWDQRAATIELHESYVATPSSEIDLSGTIGKHLDINARTSRFEDFQAFLTEPLPVTLAAGGSVTFTGVVNGPLDNPKIDGRATASKILYLERPIDQFSADFSLNQSSLSARTIHAVQGEMSADGSGNVALNNWKVSEASAFDGKVAVHGALIENLLKEAKIQDVPVKGLVDATADLRGTPKSPTGEVQVIAKAVTAWDEQIDQLNAALRFSSTKVEVMQGVAVMHKSEVRFSGEFDHPVSTWDSGEIKFQTKAAAVDVAALKHFQSRFPQWKGVLTVDASGLASVQKNTFLLTALDGDATIRDLMYDDKNLGSTQLHASTSGTNLNLTASGAIQGTSLKASGVWKFEPNYPGSGKASMMSASLQTLRDVFAGDGKQTPFPFQSALEADATFTVPLTHLDQFAAAVSVRKILISPGATQKLKAGAKEQDLVLENAQPISIRVSPTEAVIENAQFRAVNTNLSVGGKVVFDSVKPGWDLTMKGVLNLAGLQMFRQDLLASGSATVDTTIRGSLSDPQVNGTLELKKASLYVSDLPTGLDNVNGTVQFDRNRATIQTLTADSGGGKMNLSGFVGFTGASIVYRLQGNAAGVRVRYPEGASTTVNANLNLTGTSQESLLSGTVSIVRAAFNPRSDLGALIGEITRPSVSAPPPDNGYIRGMQLDVRVESAPSLEFQTTLSRGVQAEIDLRLRGTAARPTLLGDVAFNDGEISIFGNKYTLNRGDVRFFNPTRIEPVFDIEAQTKARGIDVNVSFSGTPSKLNATYRSDPPLQPSEIIALLAIGRDPNVTAGLASSQITQQSTAAGLGNVVGEAVASSVTDRLQKFFGVTRIKIDPQLTGLDNIPQAKITLEQQVSKDITLTFITNLARTQEQVVRIEWGFSREWSAIAIREENGLFGIDFQYKKRFK